MSCQVFCGSLPDIADAERKNKARQRSVLTVFDCSQQIDCGFFAHAFQINDRQQAEFIQGRGVADDMCIDQLLDQLFAESVDIHRAAAGEMPQCLLALRGAKQPAGATRH